MADVREFAADTRDAALGKAASYFGLSVDELDYKPVDDTTPVSGLGGRSLVIAAPKGDLRMRDDRGSRDNRPPREARRRDGEGRGRDRDRPDRGDRERGRGERGDRGDRGRRGGRGRGGRERGAQPARERGSRRDSPGERSNGGSATDEDDGDYGRPLTPEEQELERMAQEAAENVRSDGEPQLLPAMSSKERWVVHNALKGEAGIRSESEGEGPMRRVRILPA